MIIKGNYFNKEVVSVFNKNMANRGGLVLKIFGGLLFPFVVMTYGKFILILLTVDVWMLQSQKLMITYMYIVAVHFQVHAVKI